MYVHINIKQRSRDETTFTSALLLDALVHKFVCAHAFPFIGITCFFESSALNYSKLSSQNREPDTLAFML